MPSASAPHPGVSWSHTRHRTFIESARRYYRRYMVPGGWAPDAPPLAREIYLLKNLTNLYGVLGIALHNIARDGVLRAKRGEEPFSHETVFSRARDELNRVCLSSEDRGGFLRYPSTHPMLQDVWFHGERNPETDRRVRERLHTCTTNLANHAVWDELRACDSSSIIEADSLSTFELDGITVYAAPDLVYSPKAQNPVIGDWKAGGRPEDDHMPQIAAYALWVRGSLGLAWAPGQWQGRIMDLLGGEDTWYDIEQKDLKAAARRNRREPIVMFLIVDRHGRNTLPESVRRDLGIGAEEATLLILQKTGRGTYELVPAALVPEDQLWFYHDEMEHRVAEAEADFREERSASTSTAEETQAHLDRLKKRG